MTNSERIINGTYGLEVDDAMSTPNAEGKPTILLSQAFEYVKMQDAIAILSDVLQNDDDFREFFDEKPSTFVDKAISEIVDDDYIIGDWSYNTDQHEYSDWVIDLLSKLEA